MAADEATIRPGEEVAALPEARDAALIFIGRIETPWAMRSDCPRRGDPVAGPDCTLVLDPRWTAALKGVEPGDSLQVLYWMDRARRDLLTQSPRHDGRTMGTFALRSPNRPNPIASSMVRLVAVDGARLTVRGLDCVTGTPLLDIKPDACKGLAP
ncbi:MAG: SAM-dependent methyltransferase [Gemmobacter sp.]